MLLWTFQQLVSGSGPVRPAVGGQQSYGRLVLLSVQRLLVDPLQLSLNIRLVQFTGSFRQIQRKELRTRRTSLASRKTETFANVFTELLVSFSEISEINSYIHTPYMLHFTFFHLADAFIQSNSQIKNTTCDSS